MIQIHTVLIFFIGPRKRPLTSGQIAGIVLPCVFLVIAAFLLLVCQHKWVPQTKAFGQRCRNCQQFKKWKANIAQKMARRREERQRRHAERQRRQAERRAEREAREAARVATREAARAAAREVAASGDLQVCVLSGRVRGRGGSVEWWEREVNRVGDGREWCIEWGVVSALFLPFNWYMHTKNVMKS